MLSRALPLASIAGRGQGTITIDLAAGKTAIHLSSHGAVGPTPAKCVEILQIRPLLVGAAWKVLDLLLEAALNMAGETPTKPNWWRIDEKNTHAKARSRRVRPAPIPVRAWESLLGTYSATIELRHSLTHRTASLDSANALIGVDKNRNPLRPFTPDEQEALGRSALRAAELVCMPQPDGRVRADLTRQLSRLHNVHSTILPAVRLSDSLPTVAVLVDPTQGRSGQYALPIPMIRARARVPLPGVKFADLIVRFRDMPGFELRGRLEEAPHELVLLDPLQPPGWLH